MKKFNFDDVRINLEKDLNRAYGTRDVWLYCFFVTHDENNIKYQIGKRPGCFVLIPNAKSSYYRDNFINMQDLAFDLIENNANINRYYGYKSIKTSFDKEDFNKAFKSGKFNLELFSGEFPIGTNQNSYIWIVLNGMYYRYTVLHYLAFGATAKINPNLISSWGYELKL